MELFNKQVDYGLGKRLQLDIEIWELLGFQVVFEVRQFKGLFIDCVQNEKNILYIILDFKGLLVLNVKVQEEEFVKKKNKVCLDMQKRIMIE